MLSELLSLDGSEGNSPFFLKSGKSILYIRGSVWFWFWNRDFTAIPIIVQNYVDIGYITEESMDYRCGFVNSWSYR